MGNYYSFDNSIARFRLALHADEADSVVALSATTPREPVTAEDPTFEFPTVPAGTTKEISYDLRTLAYMRSAPNRIDVYLDQTPLAIPRVANPIFIATPPLSFAIYSESAAPVDDQLGQQRGLPARRRQRDAPHRPPLPNTLGSVPAGLVRAVVIWSQARVGCKGGQFSLPPRFPAPISAFFWPKPLILRGDFHTRLPDTGTGTFWETKMPLPWLPSAP